MNAEQFSEALGEIDSRYPAEAEAYRPPLSRWFRYAAVAACLVLAVFVGGKFLAAPEAKPETPNAGDGPPSVEIDGRAYILSPFFDYYEEMPDGYTESGTVFSEEWNAALPLATSPENPLRVFLLHKQTPDTPAVWVPYVDFALRGRDLLSYNGVLYISMWTAQYWDGSSGDVSEDFYKVMRNCLGNIRITKRIDSFVSVGIPEFSGHDLVPTGTLSANKELGEVFADPAFPDAVLVSTFWYTHTPEETQQTRHEGYDIYIRYSGPLLH